MNYFDILARTWRTIWNHKAILVFGLLAMLVPGILGLLMGGLMLFFSFDTFNLFERMMNNETWLVLAWLGFLGVFVLFSFFSTGIGWTGVFKGTFEIEKGRQGITFSELWETSWPYIARVLGILFLVGLGLSLFFVVPVILGILTAGLAFLCVLPMMLILIPLSFLSQMYMSLSIASGIADDADIFSALKRAWEVTLKNFWPLVLMSLILYLVQMVAGLVISIPAGVAQMLFLIPIMSENANPEMTFRFFGIFMMFIMPLAFLIQGAVQTYVNSAWMLVYLDRTSVSQTPETPVSVEPINA